ncbi:MAG TPA: TonB-dependent receptor plug domain-containing protein, partial [Candidatus Angelobacter sp.]|nr:TonB-dependent receptor plug domain-containing protein [Candidatus Angelobacter sp.]
MILANECRRRRGCRIAFMVLAGFALLRAQTTPDQDLTGLSVEELARTKVYSASRHLEAPREAPSAVSIITSEEIRRYGWRTLSDALNSLRGFYTSYDRNYSYLGVRGFLRAGDYNSRILLLVNGHRLNDNVYDSAQIGTEFPIDLDQIDRIEIVRGPSSSLFGSNAVFGVINVITRKAAGNSIEFSGDTSSYMGRTGRISGSFQKDRVSGVVSASMYRNDGASQLFFPEFNAPQTNGGMADNLDGDRYDHAFADLQYKDLRLQGAFSTRTKLLPTAAFDTVFNQPGTRTTDARGYFDASYHRALDPHTDFDLRGYYDAYRYDGTYMTANGSGAAIPNLDYGLADWIGIETTISRSLGRHRITAGADYEYNFRVDQKNYNLGSAPAV